MVNSLKNKLQLKRLRAAALRAAQEKSTRPLLASNNAANNPISASLLSAGQAVASVNLDPTSSRPILNGDRTERKASRSLPVVPVSRSRQHLSAIRSRNRPAAKQRVLQVPRINITSPQGPIVAPKKSLRSWHAIYQERGAEPLFRRRRRRVVKKRKDSVPGNYGNGLQLQQILGMEASSLTSVERNVTLVSLDLEWVQRGLVDRITEIGIAWMKVEDINDVDPGTWARSWWEKMGHAHIVTSAAPSFDPRLSTSLFGESRYMHVSHAKSFLIKTLESFMPLATGHPKSRVVLVGQSIEGDIRQLKKDPSFQLDLDSVIGQGYQIFDTFDLAKCTGLQGVRYESYKLAAIAYRWGIQKKYQRANDDGSIDGVGAELIGVHNAGNDAAYALMALLLFGLRWQDVVARGVEGAEMEVADLVWRETGRKVGGRWATDEDVVKGVVEKYQREKAEGTAQLVGNAEAEEGKRRVQLRRPVIWQPMWKARGVKLRRPVTWQPVRKARGVQSWGQWLSVMYRRLRAVCRQLWGGMPRKEKSETRLPPAARRATVKQRRAMAKQIRATAKQRRATAKQRRATVKQRRTAKASSGVVS